MTDPKERFSSRVDDYVRYRPGYPAALFHWLGAQGCFGPGRVVVDVGSGTGILTRGLLQAGQGATRVVGIEPNAAMRDAAERTLAGHPHFESVDAIARGLHTEQVKASDAAGLVTAGTRQLVQAA